ncbi:olfactory receptor 4B13-like [Rhinophrynus dorsalis]
MQNVSRISTNFLLLGLVEMESFKHLYFVVALMIYLFTMLLCSLIMFVVWMEESLHEPMYIFICNLLLNGIFGSSVFLPKLMVDLLSGSKTITFTGCLIQAFCIHSFAAVELFTFTIMAHDRYLALGQPLRYPTLMTNKKALINIAVIWISAFIFVFIPIMMTSGLTMCWMNINNIYCENTSLIRLACGDSSVNNIFGAVQVFIIDISALIFITYCYVRTFLICLKISKEAHQKAVQTLVTHLIAFSSFMGSSFFILFRYRLNSGDISLAVHIFYATIGLVTPLIVNPIIYGIRMEALKIKIIHNIKKLYI